MTERLAGGEELDYGPRSPFDALLGTRIREASADRVVAVCTVTSELHQPHGILHGGAYAALAETAASLGASLWLGEGRTVGIANQTEFLRAVRDGELVAEATPVHRGRSLQLWQVDLTDGRGRTVAHSRIRLMNLRSDRDG